MTPDGFPETPREKDMYRQLTEFVTYWINANLDMTDIANALSRCSRDMKKATNMLENMSQDELIDKIEELKDGIESAYKSYPQHMDEEDMEYDDLDHMEPLHEDEDYYDEQFDDSESENYGDPPGWFTGKEEPVDPEQFKKLLNKPNLTFTEFMSQVFPPDEGGHTCAS